MPAVSHQIGRYRFQALWLLLFAVLVLSGAAPRVWVALLLAALASTLLVKRAACSFACPLFAAGELLWRTGEHLLGRTFAVPFWFDLGLRSAKYLVLGWVILALSDSEMGTEFNSVPISLFVALLLLSLFLQMPWCRYLCPAGALLGLASMASLLKVRRSPRHCVRCHKCSNRCPASLPVMLLATVRSPECFACYRCVDGCPAPGALALASPAYRTVPAGLAGMALSAILLLGALLGLIL